jgi:hypothetical protein
MKYAIEEVKGSAGGRERLALIPIRRTCLC